MPLLRYRTRVAAGLSRDACPCGRTGAALAPGGRLDGRLLVNERWIDRGQVEALLATTAVAGHPCRVAVSDDGVRVSVKLSGALFRDTVRVLEAAQREVEHAFLTRFGVACELDFVEPRRWPE
jgi:phenylacetate-CoA ligase